MNNKTKTDTSSWSLPFVTPSLRRASLEDGHLVRVPKVSVRERVDRIIELHRAIIRNFS